MAKYTVRCGAAETWFSVVAAAKPEHTLTVQVTEQDSKAALDGVEIRLGPFHARTDKAGRAELRVCKGEYQLQLWRTAHIAQPTADQASSGDTSVALTMVHVPEDHPDAALGAGIDGERPYYSARFALRLAIASTLAAQNLNSGILPNGSSFGLVSRFAAAST